ncbi:MAG: hypothetical protein IT552_02130 [Sphingomonadaceae bacterium]|nr:hypothetical protein [Sphingomonadaceae bacterium]
MKQAAITGANELRSAIFCTALLLAGCGSATPQPDMPARDWRYYIANPDQIEPMQKICREWAGSNAASETQPAVVTNNCRAAAFAKSQIAITPKE